MRVRSEGHLVEFLMLPSEKQYQPPSFFTNKKFTGKIEENKEVWTYIFEVPNLLIIGQVYFGAFCKRSFYSESQKELLEELGLIQREVGLVPLAFVGNKRDIAFKDNENWFYGHIQLNDLASFGLIRGFDYIFEQGSGGGMSAGFLKSETPPKIPSIFPSKIMKATNSPSGVIINGIPAVDVENITKQATASEGIAIFDKEGSVYLPNNIEDLKGIINETSKGFEDLASVPPITGAGASTALNPAFALKLIEIANKIASLEVLLK